MQISDYDQITKTLLTENKSSDQHTLLLKEKINTLETENSTLENQVNILQEQIISLEEELALSRLNRIDHNYTQETSLDLNKEISPDIPDSNDTLDTNIKDLDVKPNITIDDENKVTGFGLEYKQNF